jgi:ABC-type transport system substrate-binding protein/class 3 adenylate cyclase
VEGAGERRIVSVLISDVVDSTTIAEKLGPERSKFLFDEIVGLMVEAVRELDGTVAQLTGDGVLALFGAPTAHGDDAERAVRAAFGIHEALARYAIDVAEAYGIELAARVAVNTGPVVVPGTDATPDVLYNALGDTVNVAARLQPSAGRGGVAIGPATARELADRFELESLGGLELKGKAEPVPAYRVVGQSQAEKVRESPLVGRGRELSSLVEALDRLEDGLGTIVSITGEPGIGKTRLVSEARVRAGADVRFLVGQASSYSTQAPFWPVRDLLRGWLGIGVADPEGRVRLELKAALAAALNGSADALYPFFASLLGLTLDGSDEERLSGLSRDSVQRQTFEAVATLFESLAREHPLCLVFEDLHWADEATLMLVEDLLGLVDREAAVIVLLFRSERDHGAWHLGELARQRFPHRLVELELRSLEPEESKLLAGGAAGADLPPEVAELLASRSGGNPFFLEEALRDLVERGVLHPVNAHWELTIAANEVTVPLLVQETLQARLDRLQPATREVASNAAVIGPRFGVPLLERLTGEASLEAALSELQRLDLVVEERRRPVREYRFRHGLVQEVAYASLTDARRRQLHQAAGEALEELRADALEEVYEPLARHFSEAGDRDKAVKYLLAAGDAAWALYADQAALAHYRQALALMADDDPSARDLWCKVAVACHLDHDFAGANTAWVEASKRPLPSAATHAPRERLVTAGVPLEEHFIPGYTYAQLGWWVTAHCFSGLLRLGPGLNVVFDTAEELRVSDDGLSYTARLRDDAVWSDGEPVTAGDFVFAWQRIREDDLPTAHLLVDIADAVAVDERTLEIRLRSPRPYFPYLLALPPTFPWPRHACEEHGDNWLDQDIPVSNGAFTLLERNDERISLGPNERWHRRRGNVGELLVWIFPDVEAADAAWDAGELDLRVDVGRAASLRDDAIVDHTATLATLFVGFDPQRPPFDDIRVRRAFAHAVDRAGWAEAIGWLGQPATTGGFVPAAMPGHSHRVGLDHDDALARELLAAAGYPGGRNLPEITLAALFPKMADLIAAQWKRTLGVQVEVIRYEPIDSDPRLLPRPAACWTHGWQADFPDPTGFLAPMLRAGTGPAGAHYRDAAILELLAQVEAATDRDERLRLVQELERVWLTEHVALAPLAYGGSVALRRPWVDGFWSTPLLPGHISDIEIRR